MSIGRFTDMIHGATYDYISPLKLDLTGKHILITGAAWSNGIGYATATAFARAGASAIALSDIHEISEDLVRQLKQAALDAGRQKPVVLRCTVDIASLESVRRMHETILQEFDGRLDILVNNAAHQEPYEPFLDSDPTTYWKTWEVNVQGLFNMVRSFLPMQLSTRDGLCTIINVSSSGALSARAGNGAYRTSKLAILRWTESLQLDYGSQGLLAYCVNPGAIKTEITKVVPQKVRDALPHHPSIAGDTIVWLATERKDWLAGRYVSCPWDMEELAKRKDEIVGMDKLKISMVS